MWVLFLQGTSLPQFTLVFSFFGLLQVGRAEASVGWGFGIEMDLGIWVLEYYRNSIL